MVTHFSFLIIMEGLEPISQLTKTGTMVISTVQREYFEGENFGKLVKNTIFTKKTFADCLLLPHQKTPRP